jgi:AbrB family looped-hinge helix DNA binding protein
MRQARISRGGQISVPAAIRRRWNTDRVLVEDRGDEVIIRPLAADPIAAARGLLKPQAIEEGRSSADARKQTRDEEADTERRTGT